MAMKKSNYTIITILFSVLTVVLNGCPASTTEDSVTGVSVDPSTVTLSVGGTVQLTATVEPASAADRSVTWSSSAEAVAAVSAAGIVTGMAAGTSVVTVTTTDGGFTATCGVTVQGAAPADTTPPAEVTDLAAAAKKSSVVLSWTEPGDADFAKVEISWTPGTAAPVETLKGTSTHEVTGLSSDTAYVFTMKTVDAAGNKSAGVTAAATTLPALGLVGEWLFGGNADDTSPSLNHGTVYEAVLTTDRFGTADSAYGFDGVDDYIIASADPLPSDERTVSLWFYTDTIPYVPAYTLLGYGGGSCGTSWFIYLYSDTYPSSLGIVEHCNENTFEYNSDSSLQESWYHLVITTDSSGAVIYLNGQNVISSSSVLYSTVTEGKDLCIGTDVSAAGEGPYQDSNVGYFAGKLDDIRIYDKALSPEEISTLYHEGGWDM
jgi:hypothetical protein